MRKESDLDLDDGPWFEPAALRPQGVQLHLGRDFVEIEMSRILIESAVIAPFGAVHLPDNEAVLAKHESC